MKKKTMETKENEKQNNKGLSQYIYPLTASERCSKMIGWRLEPNRKYFACNETNKNINSNNKIIIIIMIKVSITIIIKVSIIIIKVSIIIIIIIKVPVIRKIIKNNGINNKNNNNNNNIYKKISKNKKIQSL